jgi:hypothetical protein
MNPDNFSFLAQVDIKNFCTVAISICIIGMALLLIAWYILETFNGKAEAEQVQEKREYEEGLRFIHAKTARDCGTWYVDQISAEIVAPLQEE